MRKNFSRTVADVCALLLLFRAADVLACGGGAGSSTITNVPTLGGSAFQVNALNPAGQITGLGYTVGNLAAHAFLYNSGVLTDLGTLGGNVSQGFALNASGHVVGKSNLGDDGDTHAFLFNGTNLIDLGTLGGSYSSATAINDAGQIAGSSLVSGDLAQEAFLYANGSMTNLGDLGGGGSSVVAINQLGNVAGDSLTEAYELHAFLYTNGTMVDLGTLGGGYSSASALNDSSVVVGESSLSSGDVHGFVYSGGVMSDVGTLGGTYSTALGVNQAGQVIGVATTANDSETHGFLYNGSMTDLGTLGGDYSNPTGINNLGQVVGDSAIASGISHAFLWQKGTMLDLNTLLPENSGWELFGAQFINDAGRVAGIGAWKGVTQWFVMDLGSANNPPLAVAGPDQTVGCQDMVVLDGTQSSDPDGDALTFQWSEGNNVLGTNSTLTASFALGVHTITLTVTDPCGASSQADVAVNVTDTVPPTIISGPALAPVSADNQCQGRVPEVASQIVASDNCTPANALVITQIPAAGTAVGLGAHTIVVTVTDGASNTTAGTISFSVVDAAPPVIVSTPASLTVPADVNCQGLVPNVLPGVVATDSCTPANLLVMTQSPAAGTLMGLGKHTIVVTVTDAANNSTAGILSFSVVDTTPPVIVSTPASLTVPADVNCQGVVPNVIPSVVATDSCTPANLLVMTQSPTAGSALDPGQYFISVTVSDIAGNAASKDIPLTISAATAPPVIRSLSVSPSVLSPPNNQMVPVTVSVVASGNCGAEPVSKIISVTANEPMSPGDILITGNLSASLAATRNGSGNGRVYTITVQCADALGHNSTATVTVTVPKSHGKP